MQNSSKTVNLLNPTLVKWTCAGISLVILALYVWMYQWEPFMEPDVFDYPDNQAIDLLTALSAIAAAALGMLVAGQFQPGEAPRRVWLTFSIGWWCWVAGEIAGMLYDRIYWFTDYPELTWIDLCWSLGYFFFALALHYQFQLIYSQGGGLRHSRFAMLVAIGLILTLILTLLAQRAGLGEGISWFALYLAIFYPVFDLACGVAALWLFFLFGRGKWGRPWWGLIAFAVADSINIYFWIGGGASLSQETTDLIYLFSDTVYVAAYLIVALAFLSHYFLLRFGPPTKPVEKK